MKRIWSSLLGGLLLSQGLAFGQAPMNPPAAATTLPPATTTTPIASSGIVYQDQSQGSPTRMWGSAEYLMWWVRQGPLTGPLVTTSNNPANPAAGGLGVPGTTVVFDESNMNYGMFSGGRITLGFANCDGSLGAEIRGFLLEQRAIISEHTSDAAGNPIIGVPVNVVGGIPGLLGPNAIAESFPGFFVGSESVVSHSQLWGAEANAVFDMGSTSCRKVQLLAGYRYVNLEEDIALTGVTSNLVPVAQGGGVSFLNGLFDGSVTSIDNFSTNNVFNGGQIGIRLERTFDRFFVGATGKLAIGVNHQTVNIGGQTILDTAAGRATTAGGTLAVASNSGRFERDAFSFIPEIELKGGYNITNNLRAFVGYNFMYWTNVVRPGNQIDHNLDVSQVPSLGVFAPGVGVGAPRPDIRTSDFWAQGINLGVEVKY